MFKPQDILVKFHALLAQQTETQIEMASNQMTLDAIKNLGNTDTNPDGTSKAFGNPFLPVWTYPVKPKVDTWDNAPDNPLANVGNNGGLLSPLLMPVQNATNSARNQRGRTQATRVKGVLRAPTGRPAAGHGQRSASRSRTRPSLAATKASCRWR